MKKKNSNILCLSWCDADDVMNYGQILQGCALMYCIRKITNSEITYVSYLPRGIKGQIMFLLKHYNPFSGHLKAYLRSKTSIRQFVKRYNINSMEDLYALIGLGVIVASSFISKLKEESLSKDEKVKEENLNKAIEENILKNEKRKKENNFGVTVKGEDNLMVRFAKCCNPVPGDDVLGYITKGRGVSIHRKDCSNLQTLIEEDSHKVVDVSWGTAKGVAYMAEIQVKSEDRSGMLSDIMNVIMESKLSLNALNAKSAKSNLAYVNIKIKIDTIEQLKELMKKIRRLTGVMDVYRMNN